MKKTITISLLSLSLLFSLFNVVLAEGPAVVSLTPSSQTVNVGDTFTVTLRIDGAVDFDNMTADILFDGSKISYDHMIIGDDASTLNWSVFVTDCIPEASINCKNILASADAFDPLRINGNANIVTLYFTTNVSGTVNFTYGSNGAWDTNFNDITSAWTPASVTINAVSLSSVATVTSATYTVSSGGTPSETITNVPFGTSKATFLAGLTKGEVNQTWNSTSVADPVVSGNTLVVTAQDGTTVVTYAVTVNANPDIASVVADKAALVDNSIKGSNADLANVTVALTNPLPSTGSNGSTIVWSSNTPSVVSNDGQTINRPAFSSGNASVTMTATITKGVVSDTKAFSLTVLKLSASTVTTVTSATYTVGANTITNVPAGTSKATFLAGLTKGESNQTWNNAGIVDPVVTGNTLVVTAEDGVTTGTYTVTINTNAPTVTTSSASSITTTTATLNGNIAATGGANATQHGFAYGTSANLSTVIATTTGGGFTGTGAFTSTSARNISSLTCATTYYFRAYATNSTGTGYSSITSFGTSACQSSTKAITSFDFSSPSVTGVVNEGAKTVSLTVPFGTSVTALTPTIVTTGVSVAPASGVAQDFTNPVTYTVTAEDATTQAYVVTVSVASDNTAPTVTAFSLPSATTSLQAYISSFTATDDVLVTGYLVNESATAPLAGDTGWEATATTSYTFSTYGSKTLYAWAKDASGNVSTSLSATIIVDNTAPSIPAGLSVNADSSSQISLSWTASTDNIGVTGYNVFRNSTTTGIIATTTGITYTDTGLSASTLYTYYVRAFDAGGNLSDFSTGIEVTTNAVVVPPPSGGGGGGGGGGAPASYPLTVTLTGTGKGSVVSIPSSITCGTLCTSWFLTNSLITLQATPQAGSHLESWTGCSSVVTSTSTSSCSVNVSNSKTVIAKFTLGNATTTVISIPTISTSTPLVSNPINPTISKNKFQFTAWLALGVTNSEVANLQKVLNSQGYMVALSGIGSSGKESTYFGFATESALKKFQCAKLNVCSGTAGTTGYGATGPRTRAILSLIEVPTTGSLIIPSVTPTTPTVTATSTSTNVITKEFIPEEFRLLPKGSSGLKVFSLQKLLTLYGYLRAEYNTGFYGELTAKALAEYEKNLAKNGGSANTIAPLNQPPASTTPATINTAPFTFDRDLYFGLTGEDVKALQKFLNNKGFGVYVIGNGSPGHETTYFGTGTKLALIKFQKANGISPADGYFNSITRNKVNNLINR